MSKSPISTKPTDVQELNQKWISMLPFSSKQCKNISEKEFVQARYQAVLQIRELGGAQDHWIGSSSECLCLFLFKTNWTFRSTFGGTFACLDMTPLQDTSLVTLKVQNKETKGILIVLTSGTMPPYLSSTPLFETIKTENNIEKISRLHSAILLIQV